MDELENSVEFFLSYCCYRPQCCVTQVQDWACLLPDPSVSVPAPGSNHPAPPRLIWVQPNEMLDGLFSWGAWSKRSEVTRSNRSSRVESAWGGAGERCNVKLVRTWRNTSCLLHQVWCWDVRFCDHAVNEAQTSRTNFHSNVSFVYVAWCKSRLNYYTSCNDYGFSWVFSVLENSNHKRPFSDSLFSKFLTILRYSSSSAAETASLYTEGGVILSSNRFYDISVGIGFCDHRLGLLVD